MWQSPRALAPPGSIALMTSDDVPLQRMRARLGAMRMRKCPCGKSTISHTVPRVSLSTITSSPRTRRCTVYPMRKSVSPSTITSSDSSLPPLTIPSSSSSPSTLSLPSAMSISTSTSSPVVVRSYKFNRLSLTSSDVALRMHDTARRHRRRRRGVERIDLRRWRSSAPAMPGTAREEESESKKLCVREREGEESYTHDLILYIFT